MQRKNKSLRWGKNALLVLVLLGLWACRGSKVESRWSAESPVIDGIGEEWPGQSLEFDDDLELAYGISNNNEVLSVMFRFADQRLARRMERLGFTLWLNPDQDEDRDFGLYYCDPAVVGRPGAWREESRVARAEAAQQARPEPSGRFFMIQKDTVDLPHGGMHGLEAAVGYHGGFYCFEYRIPLGPDNGYSLEVTPGKPVKLGFVLSGLSDDQQDEMRDRMEEDREVFSTGMEEPMGSPGRRRSMGGRFGNMRSLLEEREMWVTVKLSEK